MTAGSVLYTCVKYAAAATGSGVVLVAAGLWYFQRSIIYPASVPKGSRTEVAKPSIVGLPYEDVTITTSDSVKIKAYVIPVRRSPVSTEILRSLAPSDKKERIDQEIEAWTKEMGTDDALAYAKSRPTVVIFHANAGNMGHRVALARKFNVDNRCNVFMLSYRGYGLSEGHPYEHGIKVDVEAAMEYISNHPLLGGTRLIVYGQSIGGAVALHAAAHHPDMVSGVIIENTFVSLKTLIPHIMPQLPRLVLPILLTEHWDSCETMPLIPKQTPMLLLSGRRDELIPPSQMKELKSMRESSGGKVTWRELDGTHNDTCITPEYWAAVKEWIDLEIDGQNYSPEKGHLDHNTV